MAREKGLGERLLEEGTRFVARAAEGVMKDPRGQEAVARAVGLAQRGMKRVEEMQGRLMKAAGIPGRQDYDDLAKQLARLKRKARDLAAKLAAEGGEEAGGPGEDSRPEGPDEGSRAGGDAQPVGPGEPR